MTVSNHEENTITSLFNITRYKNSTDNDTEFGQGQYQKCKVTRKPTDGDAQPETQSASHTMSSHIEASKFIEFCMASHNASPVTVRSNIAYAHHHTLNLYILTFTK